jgi:SOS-response transcriptional repressor LexA
MKGKWPNGLKTAMQKANKGPTELAQLAGTSKQNVGRFADGERELTGPWAERFASHLNVSPEQLVFPGRGSLLRVPLLSWVAAGKLTAPEGASNVDAKRHVNVADLPPGAWIALTVEGDSMNLIAPPGSIILVNRADERLQDDKFYVFATSEGAATFKRFRSLPTRLQPYSTNPDHETQYPGEVLHIVGRVRRVVTDLK